jgi:acyl-coenzyme A thioesterase PaaI-like protein
MPSRGKVAAHMTEPNTHLKIDQTLCGRPEALAPGQASVVLDTAAPMVVDGQGLIHGGFVFGAADYAAMLAVNDPNVVLGAANVRLLARVRLGEQIRANARVVEESGRKREVEVEVVRTSDAVVVLRGSFTCFVLDQHVLTDR